MAKFSKAKAERGNALWCKGMERRREAEQRRGDVLTGEEKARSGKALTITTKAKQGGVEF